MGLRARWLESGYDRARPRGHTSVSAAWPGFGRQVRAGRLATDPLTRTQSSFWFERSDSMRVRQLTLGLTLAAIGLITPLQARQAAQAPLRTPDVIFVPTPPDVVD